MSVSLISGPSQWGRVYDTNRLTYTFRSSLPSSSYYDNFQFHFKVEVMDMTTGSYSTIGTFTLYPSTLPILTGSTYIRDVEFNMSDILDKYLTFDINLSKTGLQDVTNMVKRFKLTCSEFYGKPQVVQTSGQYISPDPLILYNGCQEFISYDDPVFNPLVNKQWVMSGVTSGKFLTDMTEYRLDNDDLAFLYFLSPTTMRPTRIKYTIYQKSGVPSVGGGTGVVGDIDRFLGLNTQREYKKQSLPNGQSIINLDDETIDAVPVGITTSSVFYDTNVDYEYTNSLGAYFPMGPYQLINYGIGLSLSANTWLYYDIELQSGTTTLNKQVFRVYRKERCDRYGKYQLFWLNSHGGFDTQVFNLAHTIENTIKKTTYQVKIPLNSTTYDAGERVFNVDIDENITLRVDDLTQKESQIVSDLMMSPVVYLMRKYYYNGAVYPYGLPYIVTTDKDIYMEKVNDKIILKDNIVIRPAWRKIKQRGN